MLNLSDASNFNTAAFVLHNHIVNENSEAITFDKHPFLARFYMDTSERIVATKAGQIGFSVASIIKSIHACKYLKANVIYTLPSKSVVKDFVTPKVDPLIQNNNILKSFVGDTDSTALKSIGGRFLYFRGSWEQSAAISISAEILVSDEVDRSNPKVLETYRTRLDAAKLHRPDLGLIWKFSNPSIPGYGVDIDWQESDQKHWFIKCSRCNEWQFMSWPESVDIERKIYICKKCKSPLREEDRYQGEWKRKRQSNISGYWFNQLMVPWHSASKIIDDSKGDISVFHNFTLGLPYQSEDQKINRADILRCLTPGGNPMVNNAMGVDNGVQKHYVIGNKYGIFKYGVTEDWDEIERLRNQYQAHMVIDAMPYPHTPTKLVHTYRGKVFMCYFKEDSQNLSVIRWGDQVSSDGKDNTGIVYVDRTKIIDAVVSDIHSQDLYYNLSDIQMEPYIKHCEVMYRVIEENARGVKKAVWRTLMDKPDHYFFATLYWKVAMQRTQVESGVIRSGSTTSTVLDAPLASNNILSTSPSIDLEKLAQRISTRKTGDWRTRK